MHRYLTLFAFLALSSFQGSLKTTYFIHSRLNNLTGTRDRKIVTLEKFGDLLLLRTAQSTYSFDITAAHAKPNGGITYTFNEGSENQGWADIVNKNDGKHIYFHCSGNPKMDSDMLVSQVKMGY